MGGRSSSRSVRRGQRSGRVMAPAYRQARALRHRVTAHWPAMSTDAARPDLTSFIAGLPKAELHVHHVGSASPRIVAELASRHPDSPVPQDPRGAARASSRSPTSPTSSTSTSPTVGLLRTAEDVRMLTYEVARDLAAQQVRYAELTMTPYTSVRARHPDRGVHRGDRGRPGRRRARPRRRAALDLRHPRRVRARVGRRDPVVRAATTGPRRWSASGSAAPRSACRARSSQPHFAAARAAGLHSRAALRRVDRARSRCGTPSPCSAPSGSATAPRRCRTPRCSTHLAEHGIPLEVCPTSNVATRVVERIEEHPIRAMRDAGVVVTVNSDDPPMFGTTPEPGVRDRGRAARPRRRRASPTSPSRPSTPASPRMT